MPRLKDCCVVRAAFSPKESSFQGTAPVSLTMVTARRREEDAASLGREEEEVVEEEEALRQRG